MDRSDLGNRMKRYEQVSRNFLVHRMPTILRIDGKAFHTFTKGFNRPFDDVLRQTMKDTTKYLCENIQGCVLGYTQSDEITLVLIDYMNLNSDGWFQYNVQKMCSVAASMASGAFNKSLSNNAELWMRNNCPGFDEGGTNDLMDEKVLKMVEVYDHALTEIAVFDCRAFNVPKEDVCNNLLWRQQDALRNSIQMVGQTYFSHKELQGKSCEEIKKMLLEQKGIDWNDYPTEYKHGSSCRKEHYTIGEIERSRWVIDTEMPFLGHDRKYVDDLIFIGD